jgi:aspartate-semialdehyde dehydrogenase
LLGVSLRVSPRATLRVARNASRDVGQRTEPFPAARSNPHENRRAWNRALPLTRADGACYVAVVEVLGPPCDEKQEDEQGMSDTAKKRVAVVGATGVVGHAMAKVMEERGFPVGEYLPLATERSADKKIEAFGREWTVRDAYDVDYRGIDIGLFTAGAPVSRDLVPKAIEAGCRVVDNTTAFRMEKNVPLVVPEINGGLVTQRTPLVSCPNCTAIVLVMALAPIARAAAIERVVVTSFQSVSGAGREALDELNEQARADARGTPIRVKAFPKQIAFNCLPLIGSIETSGYTKEEEKIIEETQKILDAADVKVVSTAVRVPTRVGHAVSVNVEMRAPLQLEEAKDLWRRAEGVEYTDEIPTPLDVAGRDEVIVGRLRRDTTRPHAFSFWAVGDNLRKGAATNSVQIAELMIRNERGT